MIKRRYLQIVEGKLQNFPVVGLLGARQVGKTTLAQIIAASRPSVYLDLENYQDLAKLENPIAYFELHADKLIILDEVQRKPELFAVLRGLIDKGRRAGHKYGQFLVLGSASLELLRQSSESLAGRIVYVEMSSISAIEIDNSRNLLQNLWLRGGFPDSFLANSENVSMEWRQAFIKTYLERDIPQFAPRLPAETLRRFWIMLAHLHGTQLNVSRIASNLGINGQTVTRYVDLLVDLFLVRRLMPWHSNTGKRLVRSPKVYVRDSGILHALLNINNIDNLFSHPVVGTSWEGFVIDNLLSFLSVGTECYFYGTTRGAEVDLVIKHPAGKLFAIEIKRSLAPQVGRGFYEVCKDINPTERYVVYDGQEKIPLKDNICAVGLRELMQIIMNVSY
jgi:uncharacterized protein